MPTSTAGRRTRIAGSIIGGIAFALVVASCGDDAANSSQQAPNAQNSETAAHSGEDSHVAPAKYVTYRSSQPFKETVAAFKKAVADNGMMILGDLDQAGALKATGLQLAGAQSFFIGNPEAGKTFFEATPGIGAVIPIRMHVWADNDGNAHISYFDPEPLFTAVDPQLEDGGKKMSEAARMIANAAK